MDCVLSPGGEHTYCYLPENMATKRSRLNRLPIAILPARVNERIVAQHGVFTLHGHKKCAIDDVANTPAGKMQIRLACIELDRANLARFWHELELVGAGALAMFPELDSVAKQVAWFYQSKK